MTKMS